MQKNIGEIDRTLRVIVGVSLIVWAIAGGPVWAYIGVLPLFTGIVRWCPAYTMFGVKSGSDKS